MKKKDNNDRKYHNFYDCEESLDNYDLLIKETTDTWYENKHPTISKTEIQLINDIEIVECPFCNSKNIIKFGKRKDGIQTYKCKCCDKRFNPLTNTIFENKKIPISERIEFLFNLIGFTSGHKSALFNQNTITTGFFWLEKIFLVLEGVQDNVLLDGDVYIDEMFVNKPIKRKHPCEKELRGISRNKACIACATNKKQILILDANCSKFTFDACKNTYCKHIKNGSTIFADEEKAHNKLKDEIDVMSCIFNSKILKTEVSKENPLNPINKLHSLIREFLKRHKNFNVGKLQDRLNLARFVLQPSMKINQKVHFFIERALSRRKKLQYRQLYGKK